MNDFHSDTYEIPVDTQALTDELRRLEEKIREIAPPKIVIIHPETALTFHDGEIEKSQKYLGMDVVINDLVPPGEVLIMNEAEYNKWIEAGDGGMHICRQRKQTRKDSERKRKIRGVCIRAESAEQNIWTSPKPSNVPGHTNGRTKKEEDN